MAGFARIWRCRLNVLGHCSFRLPDFGGPPSRGAIPGAEDDEEEEAGVVGRDVRCFRTQVLGRCLGWWLGCPET